MFARLKSHGDWEEFLNGHLSKLFGLLRHVRHFHRENFYVTGEMTGKC